MPYNLGYIDPSPPPRIPRSAPVLFIKGNNGRCEEEDMQIGKTMHTQQCLGIMECLRCDGSAIAGGLYISPCQAFIGPHF